MSAFVNLAADTVLSNILELRVHYKILLEDALSRSCFAVFHFHRISGATPVDLAGFADTFDGAFNSLFAAACNVRVSDIYCDVRPLDDPLSLPVAQTGAHRVGDEAGDPMSISMAVVVDLLTGVRGRSFRGRKHLSGASESNSSGGDELNAAGLTNWGAVATPMTYNVNDGAGNTYNPCVLSPTLSDILGTPPSFTGADITSAVLNPILGTMRKRKERIPS